MVIAGELLSDVLWGTSYFPQVPVVLKPLAILVFLGFAGLEASKVGARMIYIQDRVDIDKPISLGYNANRTVK